VLFSEPKIPQRVTVGVRVRVGVRFSALQRAENSSKDAANTRQPPTSVSVLFSEPKIPQQAAQSPPATPSAFQCSSASRKFLNRNRRHRLSGMQQFQCSSASRKFLNLHGAPLNSANGTRFSALQRAENSSTLTAPPLAYARGVSVLFSEPKIPQQYVPAWTGRNITFQCSSASRKFLNGAAVWYMRRRDAFQCSSASRKFLNSRKRIAAKTGIVSFSALQRAENSSIGGWRVEVAYWNKFQCSSASRKFLNS